LHGSDEVVGEPGEDLRARDGRVAQEGMRPVLTALSIVSLAVKLAFYHHVRVRAARYIVDCWKACLDTAKELLPSGESVSRRRLAIIILAPAMALPIYMIPVLGGRMVRMRLCWRVLGGVILWFIGWQLIAVSLSALPQSTIVIALRMTWGCAAGIVFGRIGTAVLEPEPPRFVTRSVEWLLGIRLIEDNP
jgi:hypothetical protein